MDKDTDQKIAQLQLMEQNIQNILAQKQSFQAQELEVDNALDEIEKTKGNVYKIIGGVMVSSDKNKVRAELKSKKEIIELRVKNIEKQENLIKDKMSKMQKEVQEQLKGSKNG